MEMIFMKTIIQIVSYRKVGQEKLQVQANLFLLVMGGLKQNKILILINILFLNTLQCLIAVVISIVEKLLILYPNYILDGLVQRIH